MEIITDMDWMLIGYFTVAALCIAEFLWLMFGLAIWIKEKYHD
jgi:hypothetical protein